VQKRPWFSLYWWQKLLLADRRNSVITMSARIKGSGCQRIVTV